jgi:trehalose 6-phosphate phosphatase
MSAVLTRPESEAAPAVSRPPALFLDFDGTLVEIASRPDAVAVDPALSDVLERLQGALDGALAIVSGRTIATIDGFLSPHRFDVAGLHGAEHRLDGRLSPCDPARHPALRRALADARERFREVPGLLVEDKGCSFALHWRLAPERAAEALAAAKSAADALGGAYRLQHGKAVAEILPAGAAKGAVIERFLDEPAYRGRIPVFIGDDLTDEGGFAVVNARGGVSVRVGEGPTGAPKRVASPGALRALLSRWAEAGRIDLQELPSA